MNIVIFKKRMTDDILSQIMDIDKKFYKENYTLNWYKQRYNENNIAFCLYDNDKMIGYAVIAGIKEKLYNDIKNGKYTNDFDFNPNLFDSSSDNMYFVSINILEEYRGKHLGTILTNEVIKHYKDKRIIAVTISKGGYSIATKCMKYIRNVNDNVAIFEYVK